MGRDAAGGPVPRDPGKRQRPPCHGARGQRGDQEAAGRGTQGEAHEDAVRRDDDRGGQERLRAHDRRGAQDAQGDCPRGPGLGGDGGPAARRGHAYEGTPDDYARMVVKEMLPEVSREFPGTTVDARVEEGAWSREACVRLFERASRHHPLRVHADQFSSLGMIPEAIRLHARSVDHLEASTKADLVALAGSQTCGVILPCTGFHTGGRFARAGFLVDQGGAVALATNFNSGSAPTHSMPFAIALAVRGCGLTPQEAIAACTVNAAAVLGLPDRGTVEIGKRADLVLLHHADERMLAYQVGGNPVDLVICGGDVVKVSPRSE